MKNIIIVLLLILSILSCKKAKFNGYEAGNGMYFYAFTDDNIINYSFANQAGVKTKDTIFVDMRLMGKISKQSREVSVVETSGTTAIKGTHFILPKVILPADSFHLRYPVVLLNTEDLKTKTYRLVINIEENKDFIQGAIGYTNGYTDGWSYKYIEINFNNQIIKPDYWSSIQKYFGKYSDVKYKFMIDVLGFSNFKPVYIRGGIITYSEFLNYNGKLKNALEAYMAKHGPLIDENGEQVSFPL